MLPVCLFRPPQPAADSDRPIAHPAVATQKEPLADAASKHFAAYCAAAPSVAATARAASGESSAPVTLSAPAATALPAEAPASIHAPLSSLSDVGEVGVHSEKHPSAGSLSQTTIAIADSDTDEASEHDHPRAMAHDDGTESAPAAPAVKASAPTATAAGTRIKLREDPLFLGRCAALMANLHAHREAKDSLQLLPSAARQIVTMSFNTDTPLPSALAAVRSFLAASFFLSDDILSHVLVRLMDVERHFVCVCVCVFVCVCVLLSMCEGHKCLACLCMYARFALRPLPLPLRTAFCCRARRRPSARTPFVCWRLIYYLSRLISSGSRHTYLQH
jgi:hypothetical protein